MSEEELKTLVSFFKALANESRLKIVGVLTDREASVGELAAVLGLKEPTISHHLSRLRALGLVEHRAEGTSRVYRLVPGELERLSQRVLGRTVRVAGEAAGVDRYDRKVMAAFVEGERLLRIPASRRKRDVILRWLLEDFEPGRRYREREVNEIIQRHHWDSATLRRELIMAKWMAREAGTYWRL